MDFDNRKNGQHLSSQTHKFNACCQAAALGESFGMPAEGLSPSEIRSQYGVIDTLTDRRESDALYELPAGSTAKQTEALLAILKASDPLPDLQTFAFNVKDAYNRHPAKWPKATTFPWPPFPDGGHYSLAFAVPAAWQLSQKQVDVKQLGTWLTSLEPVSVVWQQGVWVYLRMLDWLFGLVPPEFDRSVCLKKIAQYIDEAERLFPNEFKLRRRMQLIDPVLNESPEKISKVCGDVSSDAENILAFTGAVFYRHPHNFKQALTEAANAGGSAEAVSFYVGSLLGALHGKEVLPEEWMNHLLEKKRIEDEVEHYRKILSV
ncbi:MAG: ADP-ribosylglycohydrolase family protein [Balneolales bacterium]